jgi:hypothetical protein
MDGNNSHFTPLSIRGMDCSLKNEINRILGEKYKI